MKKLLRFIGRYKGLLVLSLLLSTITVLIQLYIPILFGKGIDFVVEKGNVDFDGLHQKLLLILILLRK